MTYFTSDHEWLTVEGDIATVGITRHAAQALGDLIFIEVKPVGTVVVAQQPAAVVESVKAASDIYAPASGEIVEINPRLGGSLVRFGNTDDLAGSLGTIIAHAV